LQLREQGISNLSHLLATQQPPDSRIDIVRRLWLENLEETWRTLDLLEKVSIAPKHPSTLMA
jgi:hypothetical protein